MEMELRQKRVWVATESKQSARENGAEVATRNKEMKLRQKSVWLATETKPGAREDCEEVATKNKVVMV